MSSSKESDDGFPWLEDQNFTDYFKAHMRKFKTKYIHRDATPTSPKQLEYVSAYISIC